MANIPANIAPTLDAAFGQALATAGGWFSSGGNLGFSLSSLLNLIDSGTGVYSSLNITSNVPMFLGSNPASNTQSGLWIGSSSSSATANNYNILSDGTNTYLNTPSSLGTMYLELGNTSNLVVTSGIIAVAASSTSLTLKGNPATSSGSAVGVTLDTVSSISAGKILSIRNGGIEHIYVDNNGNLVSGSNISGGNISSGTFITAPNYYGNGTGNSINLNGQSNSAGTAAIIDNQNALGATGRILQLNNNSVPEFAVSSAGHLIPLSSAPSVGNFNAGFGTTTGVTITGSDAAFILTFTSGSTSSITNASTLFTVTLANGYSNSNYVIMASYATQGGMIPEVSALFIGVPISATQFNVVNMETFTPNSTFAGTFQFITMGAGATY